MNIDKYVDNKLNSILQNNTYNRKTNLVISGGGIKGIVIVGALKALQDKGLLKYITSISATSIGGLISVLYIIGYTIDELEKFLDLFDFSKIKSINISDFLSCFGFDNGEKFLMVIEKMFKLKNISSNITFLELYKKTGIKIHITGVCLNNKQVYYFSHLTYPNMSVITAIRITTSVPIWFIPVNYNDNFFVDGGCMENYPISIFDNDLNSTIGIHLCDTKPSIKHIENLEDYLIHLIYSFIEGSNLKASHGYEQYTIKLDMSDISIFDLNINNKVKKKMFQFGYNKTINSEILNDSK